MRQSALSVAFAGSMKKTLFAGVSAVVLAGNGHAADLGARPVYKAPAAAPAPWSWAGFYLGGNIGVARHKSTVSDDPSSVTDFIGTPVDSSKTGAIGGFQAGYNWQFANLVVGIEGDISFASLNRSRSLPFSIETFQANLSTLGTVRGRLGWAIDRTLFYGTGGVAFARLKSEVIDSSFNFVAAPSTQRTGWTAGGGIEYALTDHWTVKAEYLHVGFSDRSAGVDLGVGPYAFAFKNSVDIGRAGINYKF